MTAEELRARAVALELEASRYRRAADAIEEDYARSIEIDRRRRIIAQWAKEARSRTDQDCVEGLARALPCEIGGARLILAEEWSQRGRAAEARRDREIMRLARAGWTNAELGEKFVLSPKHVSRRISRALGRGCYNLQPTMENRP